MRYFYYPGCSLEGTAMEYNSSTRAVMETVGAELVELEDWTCCGASAVDNLSRLLSMVLPVRNLALAEKNGASLDFLIPCSACYLNFKKVEENIAQDERMLGQINEALSVEELRYGGGLKSRHLLDILSTDIGAKNIEPHVKVALSGLKLAPYYGCQALRPYRVFDDPERPSSMEPLIEALGAEVHPWDVGAKCCGAGLMTTKKEVAMQSVIALLSAAKGADCIVTVCPMCQMNLESFQKKASNMSGKDLSISVLYLPQVIGLAFDLPQARLMLDKNFVFTPALRQKLAYAARRAEAA